MHLRDVVCLAWAAARQYSSDIVVCCSVFSDFTSELVDVFGETSTAVRGKQFLGLIEFRYPLAQVTFYPKDCLRRLIKYRGSWVKVGRGSVPIKKNKKTDDLISASFAALSMCACVFQSDPSDRAFQHSFIHSFISCLCIAVTSLAEWKEKKELQLAELAFFQWLASKWNQI